MPILMGLYFIVPNLSLEKNHNLGSCSTQSTAWIFPLYFQLHCLHEETCFQQVGSSAVKGTSQAQLESSDQRKVPAGLSVFLKSEKVPALLSLGKGPQYRPLSFTKLSSLQRHLLHCHHRSIINNRCKR
jgi:hypothetical protein